MQAFAEQLMRQDVLDVSSHGLIVDNDYLLSRLVRNIDMTSQISADNDTITHELYHMDSDVQTRVDYLLGSSKSGSRQKSLHYFA